MVYGEHDNKFKTLNSQIRTHVEQLTKSAGKRMWDAAEGWDLEVPNQPQSLMNSTAASSGKTLREVGLQYEQFGSYEIAVTDLELIHSLPQIDNSL